MGSWQVFLVCGEWNTGPLPQFVRPEPSRAFTGITEKHFAWRLLLKGALGTRLSPQQVSLYSTHMASSPGQPSAPPCLPLQPHLAPFVHSCFVPPSHSSHSGQMDLSKMQIGTCHPSVQIPLMESLLASQCHFQPPGPCRSGPSRPFCLFSLLITLLAFPCSLTVPYSLQSQDLCTCCPLNLAPTSALVDTYSFFKS